MPISKNHQVVIVGGGITGLSVLYHLQQLGFKDALLVDDSRVAPYQNLPFSLNLSGWVDNVTRMSHARSLGAVKELYRFSAQAFAYLHDAMNKLHVPVTELPFYRVFLTKHERDEGVAAVQDFAKIGARSQIDEGGRYNWTLPYQSGDEAASIVSASMAMDALRIAVGSNVKRDVCTSLERKLDRYILHFKNDEALEADFVVLACHLQIPSLLGSLQDVFVSTTEQWHLFEAEEAMHVPPYAAAVNYSHETFVHFGDGKYLAGGARFLRKHAGVDEADPQVSLKIEEHLSNRMAALFALQKNTKLLKTVYGVECRPCDELPIIGSMFGDRGILFASGYMGQGLSFGFYAGLILAELLMYGKTEKLPSSLTPERFRSLKE